MDSFRESMDLYWFVGHKSGLKKIRFVSWITNPNLKRFGSYRYHESSQFSKDSTCFHESNKSSKNLKDLYRGFVSEKKNSQITRFVSFQKDLYTNPASLLITLKIQLKNNLTEKLNEKSIFEKQKIHIFI